MPSPHLPLPRTLLGRLRHLAIGVITVSILIPTLLLVNVLQVSSLLVRVFSSAAFRRINRWLAGAWWGLCATMMRRFHRTELVVTGDPLPSDENAIVMVNHQAMSDIFPLLAISQDHGRTGDLKFFVKDVIKYVPGVGWGMVFLDSPFLKRSWTRDRASIRATFERILKFEVPLWLVSFAEGTRLTRTKLESSRQFARERGLYVPRHTLVPRTKGFTASLTHLREHVTAVYDMTIGYPAGEPTLWQWACGMMPKICLDVHRYPLDQLPREPEQISAWVHQRFEAKDRLLDRWYSP